MSKQLSDFILEFSEKTKYYINKYEVQFKDLKNKGVEKKARVDDIMLTWSLNAIEALPINKVLKWGLKWAINRYLPSLTQAIFNMIQTKIDGITKI